MITTLQEKIECLLSIAKSMFVPGVYGLPCNKLWHPEHARCDVTGLKLLSVVSVKAVKIYTALYLLPQLLKHKSLFEGLKQTFPDVIRSAAFLTCHCYVTCAAHCLLRRLIGHYRAITVAFTPALVGSLASIGIETYDRREMLAIYMASLSLECVYEMAVYRQLIPPIRGGEVALFSLSSAVLTHFHRNKEIKINDTMEWLMKKLLSCKHQHKPTQHKYLVTRLRENVAQRLDLLITQHCNYYRSAACTHEMSCIAHTVNTGLNGLVWGTIIQMCLRLLSSGGSLRQVIRLFDKRSDLVRVSSFIGAHSAGVVAIECLLYRVGCAQQITPALAGAVSGLLFTLMPEPSGPVALYFFCRAFQCVYKKIVQDKIIPEIPYDTALLFTVSTAITIHVGVCEPHLMRPSYTAFLNYLTDERYKSLDRQLINTVMQNTLNQAVPPDGIS